MNIVTERLTDDSGWRAGRNIKEGYDRGWGLQFGKLRSEILSEPLFREARKVAGNRSVMSEGNCLNLYLLITRYLQPFADGDILEFGSYRCGNAVFMAYLASKLYPGMQVYAFDTFAGMPETDKAIDLHSAGDFGDANYDEIRGYVEKTGLQNIHLVRGLFEETTPAVLGKCRPIALLHVDADIYSACAYAYDICKPRMIPRSYIAFDDALFSSCLGATEVVENLVVRRDGMNCEQVYPHFVFRAPAEGGQDGGPVEGSAAESVPAPAVIRSSAPPRETPAKGDQAAAKPIFIIGSPRSGTSVLTWSLGQHSDILPLPETHWIARLRARLSEAWDFGTVHERFSHLGALDWTEADFLREFGIRLDEFIRSTKEPRLRFIRKLSLAKLGLSSEEIEQMEREGKLSPDPELVGAKNYQVVRSPDDAKSRWVDGAPENTFHAFGMATLFPDAKFIHMVRDPVDIAKSLMAFAQAGGAGRNYKEEEAFETWTRYASHARLVEAAFGNHRVFRLGYAELMSDPKGRLGALLDWLGEPFEPAVLQPLEEKINSSRASVTLDGTSQAQKKAVALFQDIMARPVDGSSEEALEELGALYQRYADELNAAPAGALHRKATRLIKAAFSK